MRREVASPPYEPERYELHAGSSGWFEGTRREFFRLLGGGVVVLFLLQEATAYQESGGRPRRGFGGTMPQEIGAWLHVGEDGAVTVYTGKVEVGQDIRTSLTQAVAEELHAPVASIRLVMADTALTPFDMGTFGSRTTPTMASQLRKVAAAAREALIEMAAERWHVDRGSLTAADGKVTDSGTHQSLDFGSLSRGARLMKTVSDDAPTGTPAQWQVAGHSIPKVNGRAIVTGAHHYASDIMRPGMMYGKILRPPSFQATLTSVDTRKAGAMPGVVVLHEGDFVGVAAPHPQLAAAAVEAIRAEWKRTPQPSGRELFEYLKKNPAEGRGFGGRDQQAQGSVEEGLAAAEKKLQATFTVAYIAHAPLEPRAAVAEWVDGRLTVWTGTQRPFGVRSELAQAFHLPEEQVRVIVPDTGAGYGGKHTGEVAIEAARLAKAAGKPVKRTWTREEEFTWAYFRPAGVIDVTAGVRGDGTVTAWEFHNYNSGSAGIRTLYDIPHQRIEFHPASSPLRQGSYRGLAATANHFAREMHMDELARMVGMDPLEFRLRNLKDPRLKAVLTAAAERFGWSGPHHPTGHGVGIAGGFEKGSYVATCAEVAVDKSSGRLKVVRLVTAFDCGAVVNPDHLKNQIEGAAMMGLGGALYEAIEFDNGTILSNRFSRYRVPRFSDMPRIEAVLVERKDLPPAGAGETPIVAVAPAIGNAIFDAAGVRLRSLPMAPRGGKVMG
jgi:nicotinate dehydrogenase subunit B